MESCHALSLLPPLSAATMLEFQRFLTRIGAHTSLRKNHFVVAFLQTTTEEMKSMRAKNKPQKQQEGGSDTLYRPSQGRDTNSGSLVQTKVCVCVCVCARARVHAHTCVLVSGVPVSVTH